jgi:hypothetical protein
MLSRKKKTGGILLRNGDSTNQKHEDHSSTTEIMIRGVKFVLYSGKTS